MTLTVILYQFYEELKNIYIFLIQIKIKLTGLKKLGKG